MNKGMEYLIRIRKKKREKRHKNHMFFVEAKKNWKVKNK